jgi:prepilin-type processing-associated H-X9-DG protein
MGLSKIADFNSPSESAYLLDNEDGIDNPGINRPIITGFQDMRTDLNDVWHPSHLPYGSGGKQLSYDRRIAAQRHNDGSNILFIDGHSGFRKAKLIDLDLFREKKR